MTRPQRHPIDPSALPGGLGGPARAAAAGLAKPAITPDRIAALARIAECGLIAAVGLAAAFAGPNAPGTAAIAVPLLLAFLASLLIQAGGGYRIEALRDAVLALWRVLAAWSLAALLVVAFSALAPRPPGLPDHWLPSVYFVGAVGLVAWRGIAGAVIRRWTRAGRIERRAVIVGGGEEAATLVAALSEDHNAGIRLCGLFDDRSDPRSPLAVGGVPKLGSIAELVDFARVARIDLLIVSLPTTAEARLAEWLGQLSVLPVDIRLSALTSRLRLRPRAYSYIGPVPFLDLVDRPIGGWNAVAKRAFDLFFATLALVLLSPLMLATAIAVRLDSPGPVLFRQKRYGFNNHIIEILKFRSMYHDRSDPDARVVVTRGDSRVTRVGRFIRRTSIDELPQLFNVLAGTLSLVGPRPHAVNAHTDNRLWDELVDGYFARHKVKPGITGWAQINGWRGEIDVPEKIRRRVECDLEYIDRWSLLFDFYILLVTPLRLLGGENAY